MSEINKEKIKRSLSLFLDELNERFGNSRCNDLQEEIVDLFSKKEWKTMVDDYKKLFKDENPDMDIYGLQTDFVFLSYIRKVLDIE